MNSMKDCTTRLELVSVFGFAIAIRAILSLHSYSGAGLPPKFGDYEAQRHWQEITWNLPAKQWYYNTSNNDLMYWGLDYPPLTAYHSLMMATVADQLNASYVALYISRGHESKEHKTFMRATVLSADILFYIPALMFMAFTLTRYFRSGRQIPDITLLMLLLMIAVTYPGQMLIDNGHFQYNNISLGLTIIAMACFIAKRFNWSALLFTAALNYKQMELYHALPFFAGLLSVCWSSRTFASGLTQLLQLGLIVIATIVILWSPWLTTLDDLRALVLRMFPINRGIFEDKVSNIWCAMNVLYKFKEHFTNEQMALVSLSVTLAAVLPLSLQLFATNKKSNFLYCMVNTALGFFLFSFQVHEKSILLVALPAICLMFMEDVRLSVIFWFLEVTTFSMWPLLRRDELIIAYFATILMFRGICNAYRMEKEKKLITYLRRASELIMMSLSIALLVMPPPTRYIDLWPLLISIVSCGHFLMFFIYQCTCQFMKIKHKS